MKQKFTTLAYLTLWGLALGGPGGNSARAVDGDFQAWGQFIGQYRLNESFSGYLEVFPRFGNEASSLQRLIVRPAVAYHLNPDRSFWLGYFWMPQFDGPRGVEHRPWIGYQERLQFGSLTVLLRTRFEARYLAGIEEPVFRIRQLVRLMGPIAGALSWVIWDEPFFHLTSAGGKATEGYEQNRLFGGVNLRLAEGLALEPGYMLNHVVTPSTLRTRLNHAVWMSVFLNLP